MPKKTQEEEEEEEEADESGEEEADEPGRWRGAAGRSDVNVVRGPRGGKETRHTEAQSSSRTSSKPCGRDSGLLLHGVEGGLCGAEGVLGAALGVHGFVAGFPVKQITANVNNVNGEQSSYHCHHLRHSHQHRHHHHRKSSHRPSPSSSPSHASTAPWHLAEQRC